MSFSDPHVPLNLPTPMLCNRFGNRLRIHVAHRRIPLHTLPYLHYVHLCLLQPLPKKPKAKASFALEKAKGGSHAVTAQPTRNEKWLTSPAGVREAAMLK